MDTTKTSPKQTTTTALGIRIGQPHPMTVTLDGTEYRMSDIVPGGHLYEALDGRELLVLNR